MKIFISYRRDDSAGYAGRLFDYLSAHFGERSVFMDISTIQPGQDFRQVVREAVGSCDVVLVMIGKQWLNITDDQGRRRLDDPRDWVRAEVATALADPRVRVIPVLVRDVSMPGEHELPDDLKELSWRNAFELSDARFQHDARSLIAVIEQIGVKSSRQPAGRRARSIPAGFWGLGAVVLAVLGMAVYGFQALGKGSVPTAVAVPTDTGAPPTLAPTDLPAPTIEPSPVPTPDIPTRLVQLVDEYYTCVNEAVHDRRDDYVTCWNMLSDRPGEIRDNLTRNSGGLESFIDYWNKFKVSYALYYCPSQGEHYVDAEYYHHPWDNLAHVTGGKNLLEYRFALDSEGWRIVGARVINSKVSPYCEDRPRVDKLSLFP